MIKDNGHFLLCEIVRAYSPHFLCWDMFWLGVLAKGFYRNNLTALLGPSVKWGVALCVAVADIIRGTLLCITVSGSGFFIGKWPG